MTIRLAAPTIACFTSLDADDGISVAAHCQLRSPTATHREPLQRSAASGRTECPRMRPEDLHVAIKHRGVLAVRRYLATGGAVTNMPTGHRSPLGSAAHASHTESVCILL